MLFHADQFNRRMFNGGVTIAEMHSTDRLVFEGLSLADGTSVVLTDLEDSGPTREVVGDAVPRGDGLFVTADYFRERRITARGYLKAASASAMATLMDTVRKSLRVREGELDVTEDNGTAKRYLATLENYEELFSERERYHITLCPFVAVFGCRTPFGRARDYTSTSLDLSTSPTTQSVVNSGTYTAQPVVTLNFSAASSVTAVTLLNVTTGETITYTGSIAANDVLVFDSERKLVTKNGSAVDYSGAFPTLDVGANLLTVTVAGASFTAYATYAYKPTFL